MTGSTRFTRSLAVLAVLAAMALALGLGGCGQKTASLPTAPSESSTGVATLKPVALDPASLDRAIKVQNDYTMALMVDREVVGTATGLTADGRAAVLVLTARAGVSGIPSRLDGIPVETRVVGIVTPYAPPGGGTLQMGMSTGNDRECASGTLSCVVLKGGTRYFLSNNHVFARENAASNGERIDAPGRYDGKPKCSQTPIAGTLAGFKAISFGGGSNVIDAAIALPDPGRSYTCAEACGYTPTSTTVAAFVGQAVKKCGRTSGLTHGSVTGINVTVSVQYSAGIATFTNQIMMPGNFIRSGDSGSLMVEETTNNPVGLCFAGGSGASFANPIGPVLQNFGATICSQ
ncbi:MAG TPA: hypothetical protein VGK89_11880 [Candidatus Eisenbacteria bacterium]|jgi:hypothetical protein